LHHTDKGFSDATLFPDGHAEFSDGGSWAGWEQWGQGRADQLGSAVLLQLGSVTGQ